MKYNMRDLDWVFMSFDEPNGDANYNNLLKFVPWAKRSHGVRGFDACHKAAADKVTTDVFVMVDGDCIVDPAFLDFNLFANKRTSNFAVSINARNLVNGLSYGNGSIKIWTKEFIYGMQSHENSTDTENIRGKVDFCWNDGYYSTKDTCYALTIINSTKYQAWRAGFREGAKMVLTYLDSKAQVHEKKSVLYNILAQWLSVGSDVENGIHCLQGAVHGAYSIATGTIAPELIADYEWCASTGFDSYNATSEEEFVEMRKTLGVLFSMEYIPILDPISSKWYKEITSAHRRHSHAEI